MAVFAEFEIYALIVGEIIFYRSTSSNLFLRNIIQLEFSIF